LLPTIVVVDRSLARVRQGRVGAGDRLHPLFGARGVVDVRVVQARETAVGHLDHLGLGLWVHLKNLVEVLQLVGLPHRAAASLLGLIVRESAPLHKPRLV
jgi:hypothetical protein